MIKILYVIIFSIPTLACDELIPEKEKKIYVEVEGKADENTLPVVDETDDSACNESSEGAVVFLTSEGQTYRCLNGEWTSYEDEQFANLKASLIGDWVGCHSFPGVDNGSHEYKLTFYGDGTITSAVASFREQDCTAESINTTRFHNGYYQLINGYTIFISEAMLAEDFYSNINFSNNGMYIAKPNRDVETTDLEPFSKPKVKFERTNIPVSVNGVKLYYPLCLSSGGCDD